MKPEPISVSDESCSDSEGEDEVEAAEDAESKDKAEDEAEDVEAAWAEQGLKGRSTTQGMSSVHTYTTPYIRTEYTTNCAPKSRSLAYLCETTSPAMLTQRLTNCNWQSSRSFRA